MQPPSFHAAFLMSVSLPCEHRSSEQAVAYHQFIPQLLRLVPELHIVNILSCTVPNFTDQMCRSSASACREEHCDGFAQQPYRAECDVLFVIGTALVAGTGPRRSCCAMPHYYCGYGDFVRGC